MTVFKNKQIGRFTNLLLLLCVLAASSCDTDEQCRKDKYIALNVGFYKVTYNSVTKTKTIAYYPIDSLTVQGIGSDSILYKNKKSVSTIALPLFKTGTTVESRFRIRFNEIVDTLTILHTNVEQYLSLECGCLKTHTIDTVIITNHFVDSMHISVHDVNTSTSAKEHIKLYN